MGGWRSELEPWDWFPVKLSSVPHPQHCGTAPGPPSRQWIQLRSAPPRLAKHLDRSPWSPKREERGSSFLALLLSIPEFLPELPHFASEVRRGDSAGLEPRYSNCRCVVGHTLSRGSAGK